VVPDLSGLRGLSLAVWEIANLSPDLRAPYVGDAAFAHKGGMHKMAQMFMGLVGAVGFATQRGKERKKREVSL
jgi:hypothetical protein